MKKTLILFLAVLALLSLAACGKTPTKDDYIKASVEAQCFVVQNTGIADTQEEALAEIKSIFSKYGFPVDNDEAMNKMLDEFGRDQSTQDAIIAEAEKCIPNLTE